MPTYEYVCQSCGTHVEVYQRFSEEPLRQCGICGGELRKVFHPAGLLFKGSGFYVTDSRSSKAESKPPDRSKEPSREAGAGSASKESKGSQESTESKGSKDSKDSKESKESRESRSGSSKPATKTSGSSERSA